MANTFLHFFLGKWFFAVYSALGILYFIAMPCLISTAAWRSSFFMTVALMTGSDPYSFKDVIEPYNFIWGLAFLIHIGSWLVIPALIGLVVNDAAQDIKHQQRLQIALRGFLNEAGVKEDAWSGVADRLHSELDKMIEESNKK